MSKKGRKILIIDDEFNINSRKKMIKLLEKNDVKYDNAFTLEDALNKILLEQYNGIILDMNFPRRKGEEILKRAGEELVSILEKDSIKIPILFHSIIINSDIFRSILVVNQMCPWELDKLQHFLDFLKKET